MSDVLAISMILLLLGSAYLGLLAALRLLFPGIVSANRMRIQTQTWRCLGSGVLASGLIALPAIVLINLPVGLFKFFGWLLLALGLGLSLFGAAGLAELMASRMQANKPDEPATFGSFVRAALTIELAAVFPVVGWLIFFPISLLVSLGAALLSWLRRSPGRDKITVPDLVEAGAGSQAS
jgi:hypothetical protein